MYAKFLQHMIYSWGVLSVVLLSVSWPEKIKAEAQMYYSSGSPCASNVCLVVSASWPTTFLFVNKFKILSQVYLQHLRI